MEMNVDVNLSVSMSKGIAEKINAVVAYPVFYTDKSQQR